MTKISPTRVRALMHMQRLFATSAAAAAVADVGCHPKDKHGDAGTDAIAFGPPTADASVVAVVPDAGNNVVLERDHGYMVVDPVPRPAHCPDLQGHIKGTASKQGDTIVLKVSNGAGHSGFKYEKTAPTLYGGTLVKHAIGADGGAVVTFKPEGGPGASHSVTLKGTCNKGIVTIQASVMDDLNVYISEY